MLKEILEKIFPSEAQENEKIRLEQARRMLQEGLPLHEIIRITGLHEEEIEKL